jgi:hypothetical protein
MGPRLGSSIWDATQAKSQYLEWGPGWVPVFGMDPARLGPSIWDGTQAGFQYLGWDPGWVPIFGMEPKLGFSIWDGTGARSQEAGGLELGLRSEPWAAFCGLGCSDVSA